MADSPVSSVAAGLPSAVQVLQQLPLAVLVADADQRITFANARYMALFGLPPDMPVVGLPGRALLARIAPLFADPGSVAQLLAIAARHTTTEQRISLTDGRRLERTADTLPDGGWVVTYRDITAETHAQQQEHQARYELAHIAPIPAQNPNPIFRVGADGQALYHNAAAERLWASLPPEAIAAVFGQAAGLIESALTSGMAQQATLTAEGRVFDASLVPFPHEQYVNLYLTEATARHAAEAETRRLRAFYESILNHLPADVVVLGPDLRYRYLNPQSTVNPELRDWIIGRDDLEYFAHRGRPAAAAEFRQRLLRRALADGRQVSWEEEVPRRDGQPGTQHLLRFVQPVFDEAGDPLLLIGYGLDITPIREAQLATAHSEKQYRDLMQYTQALICTHDLAGTVLTVNPATEKLLHTPAAGLVGRSLIDMMPPEDRPTVVAYLAGFATGPTATSTGVLRLLPPGARRLSYLLYHNIRIEEAGRAPYIIGYAQDISERIRAERAALQAKETAEAATRARESFLANMSHEIRTPLNGVLGMVALLEKTPLTPEQQQYTGLIHTAGRSLLALLNDVLDMSKISSGKLDLAAVPFDLCITVRDAAQTLAIRAVEKGIGFEVIPLGVPELAVVSDPQRLHQILTNLLANAIKFTERGGVTLHGRLGPVTAATYTVTFLVTDTGIGIAPEHQERVFEEFTQAYTDTSHRFGGTGLGLAISEQLVAQLGGRLVLSSELGVGTTFGFTVTLPRTTLQPAAPVLPTPPTTHIAGLRVLLVEDNAVNRLVARLLLGHHGVLVTEAVNGAEAVAYVRAQAFDVVLMDIQMPAMNGLEATAAIRALPDPARAQVPILALTANAFRSDTERYLAAGMDGCLTKPFDEAELVRVLAELTGGAALPAGAAVPEALPAPPAEALAAPPAGAAVTPPDASPPPGAPFPATALWLGRGNGAFVRRLVDEFLATTPALLTRLEEAGPAAAVAIAHQLVPSARTFDAPEAAAALADLEAWPPADPQWASVRAYAAQEVAALLQELQQWRATA